MNIEKITQGKNLTDTERTVLEYILDHLDTVQTEGVRGVARANYTSTSTIMRLARKMNYSGFVDMCYKLRSFTETPHQTMQEEEDFLNGFSTQSLLNYNTYTQLKICAEKLLEQRDKMIFVYGTGFSGTVATYLTQKLVNRLPTAMRIPAMGRIRTGMNIALENRCNASITLSFMG